MGLSSNLDDVSSDSIAIVVLISAVRGVCYLRYLVLCLLGFSSSSSSSSSSTDVDASGLAGLAVLADSLQRSSVAPSSADDGDGRRCSICLDEMRAGAGGGEGMIRRLACCHVYHRECIDWWLVGDESRGINWSCPLCRAAVAAEEKTAEAERRIGAEIVAWLAPY